MIAFEVKDMTCGHCISTITRAVKALDAGAQVHVDLAAHRVEIESNATDAAQMGAAIKQAGYTPVAMQGAPRPAAAKVVPARNGGCCCR